MPPRRLALIVIIAVVILIIAVFLWLIFGLLNSRVKPEPQANEQGPESAPAVSEGGSSLPEETRLKILESLRRINETPGSSLPEEKRTEILESLKAVNTDKATGSAGAVNTGSSLSDEERKAILDSLR